MKKTIFITLFLLLSTVSFGKKKFTKDKQSAIQKKYMKKIVFSHNVIEFNNENENEFITKFTHGETLHFRVYMEKPLGDILREYRKGYINPEYAGYKWQFILDGKEISTTRQIDWSRKAINSWSTWRGSMNNKKHPEIMGNQAYDRFINAAAIAEKMTKGKHILEIKLYPENPLYRGKKKLKVIASAKLTMNIKAGFKPKCLPKANMKNRYITKQMLKVVKKKASSEGWKEAFNKAIIISEDWSIQRDITFKSRILRRVISGLITAKWPDGHCSYQGFSFAQEYDGSKYSKKLKYYGTGEQIKIPCSCVK